GCGHGGVRRSRGSTSCGDGPVNYEVFVRVVRPLRSSHARLRPQEPWETVRGHVRQKAARWTWGHAHIRPNAPLSARRTPSSGPRGPVLEGPKTTSGLD